jgi:hypothetical protein
MGTFEKFFVNRPSRSQRVTEHAEKILRLAGSSPGQSYSLLRSRILSTPC